MMIKIRRGQALFEWVLLFASVVAVMTAMISYVRQAVGANVKSTEMQLNGAMQDNRP